MKTTCLTCLTNTRLYALVRVALFTATKTSLVAGMHFKIVPATPGLAKLEILNESITAHIDIVK